MKKSKPVMENVDNWNNAKRYSDEKIQGILEVVDKYEDIATFGYENLDDKLNSKLTTIELHKKKIEGFKYLIHKLVQILNNSNFAIVNKRLDFEKYKKQLLAIYDFSNPPNGHFNINQSDYTKLLKFVKDIKSKINVPLNSNNLIFMSKTEIDLKQAREDFINEASGDM